MSLFSQLLAVVFILMLLSAILFVVFGQVTVRKLRKNPKTKDVLGLEYASGWDIINVAQALAFPKSWSRLLEKSPLSFIYANSSVIFENTSRFDQILGMIFYWLLMISGLAGILLIFLNFIGLLPG